MHKYKIRIANIGSFEIFTRMMNWDDIVRTSDLDLPAFARSISNGFIKDPTAAHPRWVMPASIMWVEQRS